LLLNIPEREYNTLIVHLEIQTEVRQLGTGRSSMETLILTCLQAQLIAGRVNKQDIPRQYKNDLIWEIKQISPKECKIDAKVD
jgi:hypothetical protein